MENNLVSLTSIIVLGITAQWLAWRFNLPSILLMLLFGVLAGPVTNLVNPNVLFGNLLFPIISLSVAIILFEGGLSLKWDEVKPVRRVVFNLVTIGALITWILSSITAHFVLHLDYPMATLFGAILVVSGPTVIIPLLIQVRPIGQIGSVIKWEGIVNDPVGAILAVLVFEAIKASNLQEAQFIVIGSLISTILQGTAFGLLGAVVLIIMFRYYLVPDYLQNPVALMIVIGFFTASNIFQEESGLLTVTIMGIILANQPYVSIRQIIEFKENLRVLLISVLFIVLGARLKFSDFADFGPATLLFLAILLFVIRPAAVWLSTLGSELNRNERLFLSWMAPRGIVAAAVASIFALELEHVGLTDANRLAPLTFTVIIGTVSVYGLTAVPIGRWLKVAQPNPQGAMIAGAHSWAREIGKLLQAEGYRVLFIDTNRDNITAATQDNLPVLRANIVSDYIIDKVDLVGIGRLMALTPNDEVNSLAALHFNELFGRAEVYQLPPHKKPHNDATSQPLSGRLLFDTGITYAELNQRFEAGAKLEKITLSKEFDFAAYQELYKKRAISLFLIDETGRLNIFTIDQKPQPQPGQSLISLITPLAEEPNHKLSPPPIMA